MPMLLRLSNRLWGKWRMGRYIKGLVQALALEFWVELREGMAGCSVLLDAFADRWMVDTSDFTERLSGWDMEAIYLYVHYEIPMCHVLIILVRLKMISFHPPIQCRPEQCLPGGIYWFSKFMISDSLWSLRDMIYMSNPFDVFYRPLLALVTSAR